MPIGNASTGTRTGHDVCHVYATHRIVCQKSARVTQTTSKLTNKHDERDEHDKHDEHSVGLARIIRARLARELAVVQQLITFSFISLM